MKKELVSIDFKTTDRGKFWGIEVVPISETAKKILKKYVGYDTNKKMIPHSQYDSFQDYASKISDTPITYFETTQTNE